MVDAVEGVEMALIVDGVEVDTPTVPTVPTVLVAPEEPVVAVVGKRDPVPLVAVEGGLREKLGVCGVVESAGEDVVVPVAGLIDPKLKVGLAAAAAFVEAPNEGVALVFDGAIVVVPDGILLALVLDVDVVVDVVEGVVKPRPNEGTVCAVDCGG